MTNAAGSHDNRNRMIALTGAVLLSAAFIYLFNQSHHHGVYAMGESVADPTLGSETHPYDASQNLDPNSVCPVTGGPHVFGGTKQGWVKIFSKFSTFKTIDGVTVPMQYDNAIWTCKFCGGYIAG